MTDADPSADLYGGGGLVADVRDLARFYAALVAGDVFDDPATLTTMTSVPDASADVGGGDGPVPVRSPGAGHVLVAQRVLGDVRHRLSATRRSPCRCSRPTRTRRSTATAFLEQVARQLT